MLDTRYCMLDTRCSILDSRYWILDAREWLNGSLVIPLRVFRFAPRLFTNDDFLRVSADTKTWAACPTRAVLRNN